MIDALSVAFFPLRIFHSSMGSPFPNMGRPKFNINHLLFTFTLFQALNYQVNKRCHIFVPLENILIVKGVTISDECYAQNQYQSFTLTAHIVSSFELSNKGVL